MGMTSVACLNVGTPIEVETMTSTLSRTNSAAISAWRAGFPSDQRYSIAMVRPSIQPNSRSRCTNAAVQGLELGAASNPMVGSLPACCACAASGHAAAAPPSSVMNSRRRTSSTGLRPPLWARGASNDHRRPPARTVVCCRLSLPRWWAGILGADLNRSEASRLLISQGFLPRSGTNRYLRRTLRNKRFSRASGTTADQRARSSCLRAARRRRFTSVRHPT
jgi:hypothetical protein